MNGQDYEPNSLASIQAGRYQKEKNLQFINYLRQGIRIFDISTERESQKEISVNMP